MHSKFLSLWNLDFSLFQHVSHGFRSSRTFFASKNFQKSNRVSQGLQVVPFIFIFCQGTKAPKGKGHCQRWREDKDRNTHGKVEETPWFGIYRETFWRCAFPRWITWLFTLGFFNNLWCTQGNRAKLIADAQIPVIWFMEGNSKVMPGVVMHLVKLFEFYRRMNGTHNTYPLYTDEYVSYILLSSYIKICIYHTHICI